VEMAAQTDLTEYIARAVRARREHLAAYADAPSVRQLDERLRAAVA
jgi:hypothetical protein